MPAVLVGLLAGLLASAAPGRAEPVTVTVSAETCRRLAVYRPDAEVPADLEPGVDVRGRPVAPADLGGGVRLDLPERFTFDLEISLFEPNPVLPDPLPDPPLQRESEPDRLGDSTLTVGTVTVEADGRVYFNGQPLQDEEAWALSRRCRAVLRR